MSPASRTWWQLPSPPPAPRETPLLWIPRRQASGFSPRWHCFHSPVLVAVPLHSLKSECPRAQEQPSDPAPICLYSQLKCPFHADDSDSPTDISRLVCIASGLLDTSLWLSHEHVKLNVSRSAFVIFPSSLPLLQPSSPK